MATIAERPKTARPPGPKGHWLMGNLPELRPDRLGALTRWAREYGDMVSVRLAHRRIWALNHPDLIEEVLVTKNRCFTKHFALKAARPTLGEGLLTSEGDFWRRQRKLSQPAFHRERVASYADVMVRYAEELIAKWSDGQTIDIHEEMMLVTLRIVVKTLFDADVGGDALGVSHAMEILMQTFTARINRFIRLPDFLPTPANRRHQKALDSLEAILFRIIADRRASGTDRGDLLSMLLQAQDEEDGSGMSDKQLRDETMTLFLAGHETTANTLTWAFYLLAEHPEVEARLHEELDRVLDDRPPSFADLSKLAYTDQVITETLRIYPTVWLLGREAVEPVEIGGLSVPKGTTMWMSQWVVHRDPRWYDDPETFRPERWADGLIKRLPRYAYFPFGGGPRICIGNSFAQMEAVLILATIAREFRLKRSPGVEIKPLPTMTLRPRDGLPMIVERRTRPGHPAIPGVV